MKKIISKEMASRISALIETAQNGLAMMHSYCDKYNSGIIDTLETADRDALAKATLDAQEAYKDATVSLYWCNNFPAGDGRYTTFLAHREYKLSHIVVDRDSGIASVKETVVRPTIADAFDHDGTSTDVRHAYNVLVSMTKSKILEDFSKKRKDVTISNRNMQLYVFELATACKVGKPCPFDWKFIAQHCTKVSGKKTEIKFVKPEVFAELITRMLQRIAIDGMYEVTEVKPKNK